MQETPSHTRRGLLKGTTIASISALAGCSSRSGESSGQITMGTSTTQTSINAVGQTMAAIVNENSDTVTLESQPTEGSDANIGLLNRGEIDIGYTQNWTVNNVIQGTEIYENVDVDLNAYFHCANAHYLFVTPTSRPYTSITDITSDTRVSTGERGEGAQQPAMRLLELAANDFVKRYIPFTSQAGPFQDGSIDVGLVPIINSSIEPSYVQQLKSQVDLRVLQWPENIRQDAEQDELVDLASIDLSQFDGYNIPSGNTAYGCQMNYGMAVRAGTGAKPINEILSLLLENNDRLAESNALYQGFSEKEYFPQTIWDIPYHPGAKDAYKEYGLWQEDR